MSTVWDPAHKSATVTLSNGNHTCLTTAGGNLGVHAVGLSHATGKWYLEFSGISSSGSSGFIGVAAATDALGTTGEGGVDPLGNLHGMSGNTTMPGGLTPIGRTVGLAIDLDNKRIWGTYDGVTWSTGGGGAGNPTANVGGLDLTGIGTVLPSTWLQNNPTGNTLNCGDSAFALAVPSGFTGWDVPVIIPKTQGALFC